MVGPKADRRSKSRIRSDASPGPTRDHNGPRVPEETGTRDGRG